MALARERRGDYGGFSKILLRIMYCKLPLRRGVGARSGEESSYIRS